MNAKGSKTFKSQNSILCEKIAKGINSSVHQVFEEEHELYDKMSQSCIVPRSSPNGTTAKSDKNIEEHEISILETDENDGEIEQREILENDHQVTYNRENSNENDGLQIPLNESLQSTASTVPELYESNNHSQNNLDTTNGQYETLNNNQNNVSLSNTNKVNDLNNKGNQLARIRKDTAEAVVNYVIDEPSLDDSTPNVLENENGFTSNQINIPQQKSRFTDKRKKYTLVNDQTYEESGNYEKISPDTHPYENQQNHVTQNTIIPKDKKKISKRYQPVIYHTDSSVLTGSDRFEFLYLDAAIRAYKLAEKRKEEEMQWKTDYFRPEITQKGRRSSYVEAQVGLYSNDQVKVDCSEKVTRCENDQASPRYEDNDMAAIKDQTEKKKSSDQSHQAYLEKLHRDGERMQCHRKSLEEKFLDKELTFQPNLISSKSYRRNVNNDSSYNRSESYASKINGKKKKSDSTPDIYTRSVGAFQKKKEKNHLLMEEILKNCTFRPEINHKKKKVREPDDKKQKNMFKEEQNSTFEELYHNHKQIELKKQEKRLQLEMEESKELTLIPQISKFGAGYEQKVNIYRRLSDPLIHFNNKTPEARRSSIGVDPRINECTFKPHLYNSQSHLHHRSSKIEDRSNLFLKSKEAKIKQLQDLEEEKIRQACTFQPILNKSNLTTGNVKGRVMTDLHQNYYELNKKLAIKRQNKRLENELKNCTFEPCTNVKEQHRKYLQERRGNQQTCKDSHKYRYNDYNRNTTYMCLAGTENSGFCTENHLTKKVKSKENENENDDEMIVDEQSYEGTRAKSYIPQTTIKETIQYSFLNEPQNVKGNKGKQEGNMDTIPNPLNSSRSDLIEIHKELKELVTEERKKGDLNAGGDKSASCSFYNGYRASNITKDGTLASNFTNRETPSDMVVEDYINPEKNERVMKRRQWDLNNDKFQEGNKIVQKESVISPNA